MQKVLKIDRFDQFFHHFSHEFWRFFHFLFPINLVQIFRVSKIVLNFSLDYPHQNWWIFSIFLKKFDKIFQNFWLDLAIINPKLKKIDFFHVYPPWKIFKFFEWIPKFTMKFKKFYMKFLHFFSAEFSNKFQKRIHFSTFLNEFDLDPLCWFVYQIEIYSINP